MAPEKLVKPDPIAVEILLLVDGERIVTDIAKELSKKFNAPEDVILGDVKKCSTTCRQGIYNRMKNNNVKLKKASDHGIEAPLALLAELSHRCPLQCPYCSNPVNLEKKSVELTLDEWKSVIDQSVEIGIHQIHFSGGEPTVRTDLEEIVEHCTKKVCILI